MSEDKDGVPQWYLIKHERGESNKELLMQWLSLREIECWAPVMIRKTPRADNIVGFRRRSVPVFPGYIFVYVTMNKDVQKYIMSSSAFHHIISAGKALLPVKADVVERLKRIFPETGIKEDVNKKDKETLVYLNNEKNNVMREAWLMKQILS
ncbi:hypothetical protein RMS63_004273 [Salmonella enterica]|uniref:NusG-like N-terminal domain-containing protein n=23 Tax=Salmonella TaxID=590 RepID=A0A3V4P9X8_SALET|nr:MULTISPECIES: transcription termination/antitermination NusG family protein [Salmonella]EAA7909026.1 hypothetical protein [Salmonella enterica subsp. enterica serovar Cerro]EAA8376585.1 hypothetical protein [Salmonella enterica subsp. enterica serovar Bareilly]EAB8553517.1 hypothetical protein [Salmonella enterica subsp. enterica serovar Infantis]EAQ4232026.1 hypothetical protein [Salmonella enterica subsp. enterica serovar Johannesburg]EAT6489907.1 hypothetical protein [Salmonella enterica